MRQRYDHVVISGGVVSTCLRTRRYHRLNSLAPAFELLVDTLLQRAHPQLAGADDRVIDSLPVILARSSRATNARVAREIADKTFCASKNLWYHGVKLHVQAVRRCRLLPLPEALLDRSFMSRPHGFGQMNLRLGNCALFADKAYACQDTKADFDKAGTALATPTKKEKHQPLEQTDSLWSRFVSSMRQPVESLFNWVIEKTGIQNAAKVRSTDGLFVHCYGKLAVACVLLVLYP